MSDLPIATGSSIDEGGDDELVWKALSHRLRRQMLDELRSGPLRTGDLAARLDASRHVVMQHLNVLRNADLVHTVARGRVRMNHLNPVPIQRVLRRWVSSYEGLWAEALLGLKGELEGRSERTRREGENVG